MNRQAPQSVAGERREAILWFGLLGGAVAWFIHLTASYLLSESACATTLGGQELLGVPASLLLQLAITLVAGLVALAAAVAGYRSWTVWKHEMAAGSSGFVGLAGFILSSMFLFIIIVETIPALFLSGCERL
jgi:hypothetical protein